MGDKYKINPFTGKMDNVGEETPKPDVPATLEVTPDKAAGVYEDGSTLGVKFSVKPTKGSTALGKLTMTIGSTTTTIAEAATSGTTYTAQATITTDTTVKFTLLDAKNTIVKSVSYTFGNMRYIGFANEPTGGESAITEEWLDSHFAPTNKTIAKSFVIAAKKYSNSGLERFYVVVAKSTGCTSENIQTLEGGEYRAGMMEDEPTEVTITTSTNKQVVYLVFRSDHKLTTAKDVTVKVQ